jgi:hypothetical protein
MGITSLTLACFLLAAEPAQTSDAPPPGVPAPVVAINKRNFKIPILIEPSKRPQIKLLRLYVSNDQGQSWGEVATRTADQDHFAFYAPTDGIYWFTVAVVDQQDRQIPPDPYKAAPNQKILVDTTLPEVMIVSADRENEEVSVGWEIKEEHPDLESLRLEYRPANAPPSSVWYAVPVKHELSGKASFHVDNPAALTLRLEIKDEAGNLGSVQKQLPPGPQSERLTAAPPTGGAVPTALPTAVIPVNQGASPLLNNSGSTTAHSMSDRLPAPGPLPSGTAESMPMANRLPPPAVPGTNPLMNGSDSATRVVAWSGTDSGSVAGALPGATTAHGMLPNVMVVNDAQLALEYEIKCGPSGVGKVEVFLTEDDGKSWRFWAEDTDKKSPVTVKLPGQGVFGLRLVTTSGAGLSEGPPQPGDSPELRVEVDTTPPMVQLIQPVSDPQRPDNLLLTWNASDRNLAKNPVTLEYAEPAGHWQVIAANQPSSGSYSWTLPKPLSHVQLRVTAVDTAGNRSIAETREPILVDLNKTKARIVGIAPTPKRP